MELEVIVTSIPSSVTLPPPLVLGHAPATEVHEAADCRAWNRVTSASHTLE